jgi:CTP:molybdopterin cytidylyltransferase MocA
MIEAEVDRIRCQELLADVLGSRGVAKGLRQGIATGRAENGGWFACWHADDPDAAADHFRYRLAGCPTEAEAVAAFLRRERDRLDRLETVADLVRQVQALSGDPAHHAIAREVWDELLAVVADLDREDGGHPGSERQGAALSP